jgi:hypothetical protein
MKLLQLNLLAPLVRGPDVLVLTATYGLIQQPWTVFLFFCSL